MNTLGIQRSLRNSRDTGYQNPGSIVLFVTILLSCHITLKYMDILIENSLSLTERMSRISTLMSTLTGESGLGDSNF